MYLLNDVFFGSICITDCIWNRGEENKKQRAATYSSKQKQNRKKEKIERGTFYCGIKFGLHVLQLSSKLFANDFTVIFQMGESKIVFFFLCLYLRIL